MQLRQRRQMRRRVAFLHARRRAANLNLAFPCSCTPPPHHMQFAWMHLSAQRSLVYHGVLLCARLVALPGSVTRETDMGMGVREPEGAYVPVEGSELVPCEVSSTLTSSESPASGAGVRLSSRLAERKEERKGRVWRRSIAENVSQPRRTIRPGSSGGWKMGRED